MGGPAPALTELLYEDTDLGQTLLAALAGVASDLADGPERLASPQRREILQMLDECAAQHFEVLEVEHQRRCRVSGDPASSLPSRGKPGSTWETGSVPGWGGTTGCATTGSSA